jgi:DNA-binding NarL/FixJ family response regulator
MVRRCRLPAGVSPYFDSFFGNMLRTGIRTATRSTEPPAPRHPAPARTATRQLSEHHPGVAVVILTTYADDASILGALEAGACSYLTKNADRADITQTLRSAATGLSVIDPAVKAALLKAAATRRRTWPERALPGTLPDGLTQRQAEILSRIAQGMTNSDIAAELYLSSHTVKTHVNHIFAKTGSADRAAAIRYARDHHLC